jgi:RHS repeat-associated protein
MTFLARRISFGTLPTLIVFILFVGSSVYAQVSTSGTTPLALSPGAPAGSYPLSDFDNVNLFNGSLNFSLALVRVGGRGGTGYPITLRLDQKWQVAMEKSEEPPPINIYYPQAGWWSDFGFAPMFSMGRMEARQGGTRDYVNAGGCGYVHRQTLTRLTFTAPDGTEYELRDQQTNGQPVNGICGYYDRGTVFVTADGTGATFISDNNITDYPYDNPGDLSVSGYMMLKDGSRFRIIDGDISWMRDRNGNKLAFTYDSFHRLTVVTDSLNRQTTIAYGLESGSYDQISYKGAGGTTRTVKIYYAYLQNTLRGDLTAQTLHDLFPDLNGVNSSYVYYDPLVVSAVELPNGKQYQFKYDGYLELSRVVLPTGGAIEYDYAPGLSDAPTQSGVLGCCGFKHIYRRLIQRRIYPDGGTGTGFTSKTTYSRPESSTTNTGYVDVNEYNTSGSLLGRSLHYFYGSARDSFSKHPTEYPAWTDGKEYKTETFDTNGTTLLRRLENNFEQRAAVSWWASGAATAPPNDVRPTETITTLADTNLVSKQTFGYDDSVPFNNQNNVKEYDFGSGSPGLLLRETQTTYLTGSTYTDTPVHIRSLASQISVYNGSNSEKARTTFEYDNYTLDGSDCAHAFHCGLVSRSSVSGFDVSFGTSYTTRGNVTGTTQYFLSGGSVTGSISSYSQYDVLGNVLRAIDPRSTTSNIIATRLEYDDRFGTPNGNAQNNTAPTELSSLSSYAFPTKVTNALGHIAYAQFDYYLGRPVDGEDANGIVASGFYDDSLDRPTKIQRAVGTSLQNQTTFTYDDTNRKITTTSDRDTNTDGVLVSKIVYDQMGRTIESQQFEGGTDYIVAKTEYDALGRAYKTSNPYRPATESSIWTTKAFDALGRLTTVTTPDSAVVTTSYSGNSVTVSDQAGKQRKSVTDGLGRLIEIYENPASLNYLTSYTYDTLDNLTGVAQGSQTRTFAYDSLKRLTSAINPESGTMSYQYDNAGNLTQKTDSRGVVSTYGYDALSRNISVSYSNDPSATLPITRVYDLGTLGIGKLYRAYTTGTGASKSTINGYDELGRPSSLSQQFYVNSAWSSAYTTSRTHNLAGGVSAETYPSDRSVGYSYDAAGRLNSFIGNLGDGSPTPRSYSSEITYSPFGGLAKEKFGTDIAIYNKLFYNVRGQLAEIRESTSYTGATDTTADRGAIINHYSYQCWGMCAPDENGPKSMTDNDGNLKKQEVQIPGAPTRWQQYDYDSLNRLQWVREIKDDAEQFRQWFSYDRFGNRTIDTTQDSGEPHPRTYGVGINSKAFTVNATNNRLGVPSGQTGAMTYDAAGNLINDTYTGEGTRTYDAENRMTQAGSSNQYTYNADGQRVRRNINGVETWQIYGLGGELLAEYEANAPASNPQKEYGYRNGQLLVTVTVNAGWGAAPSFTGPNPLSAGSEMKLENLTELRTAINQLRAHAGLPPFAFTVDPDPERYVTTIKADHIRQLRAALEQARSQLELSTGGYAHGTLTENSSLIFAIDFQELRDQVLSAWQTASGVDLQWLVTDQLGTPRMVFDESGTLANVRRHDYLPFGEEIPVGVGGRTGGPNGQGYGGDDGLRQKFTQKERDIETGLDYFLARYYSSTQGRFTSPDEFKGGPDELYVLGTGDEEKQALPYAEITNPQSLNKYSYTYNNPLRYVDPDGHDVEYENARLRQQFEKIAQQSKAFGDELTALNDDHKITVAVVERGLKTNDEKSSGDATITFNSDGTTRVVIAVDSYGRTPDKTKEHEVGHAKDARTNREQLRKDALKTQKNKGGPGQKPHDERPEEKRANAFRDQVERERKEYKKQQDAERKRQKQQKRKGEE